MDPTQQKIVVSISLILLSAWAGYVCRKRGWVGQETARRIMTLVAVAGFSTIGLLTLWVRQLEVQDFWPPLIVAVHLAIMTGIGLLTARILPGDAVRRTTFGIASGLGNIAFTMGGTVLYILYDKQGLQLSALAGLLWMPMIVLFIYPIARRAQPGNHDRGFARLMFHSIFDIRSTGLAMMILGLGLSISGVPQPEFVQRLRIVDILMYLVIALAYFSIGLRLHFAHVRTLWKMILALGVLRFLVAPAVGAGLILATRLTPWPLHGQTASGLFVEMFVPVGLTTVAVANMFRLRGDEASILFVANTVIYLALVLPVVILVFG
jgi:predicted permease